MGGLGSGRTPTGTRKLTVEECIAFSAKHLVADSDPNFWTECERMIRGREFRYSLRRHQDGENGVLLRLGRPPTIIRVPFSTTRSEAFGCRDWIHCPYPVDGGNCGRRVGKIYLTPISNRLGCRHCHNLTYWSSQNAHLKQRTERRLSRLKELF